LLTPGSANRSGGRPVTALTPGFRLPHRWRSGVRPQAAGPNRRTGPAANEDSSSAPPFAVRLSRLPFRLRADRVRNAMLAGLDAGGLSFGLARRQPGRSYRGPHVAAKTFSIYAGSRPCVELRILGFVQWLLVARPSGWKVALLVYGGGEPVPRLKDPGILPRAESSAFFGQKGPRCPPHSRSSTRSTVIFAGPRPPFSPTCPFRRVCVILSGFADAYAGSDPDLDAAPRNVARIVTSSSRTAALLFYNLALSLGTSVTTRFPRHLKWHEFSGKKKKKNTILSEAPPQPLYDAHSAPAAGPPPCGVCWKKSELGTGV